MLTRRAKQELREREARIRQVMLYGELNDKQREELRKNLVSIRLAIKEMDRIEERAKEPEI